jgi:hypothetical protein
MPEEISFGAFAGRGAVRPAALTAIIRGKPSAEQKHGLEPDAAGAVALTQLDSRGIAALRSSLSFQVICKGRRYEIKRGKINHLGDHAAGAHVFAKRHH